VEGDNEGITFADQVRRPGSAIPAKLRAAPTGRRHHLFGFSTCARAIVYDKLIT
jgi:hypothetical protein